EITAGRSVSTLAADELFSYLCVHGASSLWFRLKWITDLAALLSACPATEIERLYSRSQELGAGRAADQALLLAHHFYRTLDGTGLADRLERDRTSCWLAAAARCQLSSFTEPTERPFGTLRIHWTQLLLRRGIAFKLNEIARQISDAIA